MTTTQQDEPRTYQYKVPTHCGEENTFGYSTVPADDFEESRNAGNVVFCEFCEDYFAVAFGEPLCFKCREFIHDVGCDH